MAAAICTGILACDPSIRRRNPQSRVPHSSTDEADAPAQDVFAFLQVGSLGILADIATNPLERFPGPNQVVEAFVHPERPCGFEVSELLTGKGLPGMEDAFERVTGVRPYDDVSVVGHDDELVEEVTVAVEMEQSVADNGGAGRVFEGAGSSTRVQPLLDLSL